MWIEILGAAAGGGFPQWNCACPNCRAVRAGTFQGKPRTQTQVAVSGDGKDWFLLNASPDLRIQIEATPALHPKTFSTRDGVRDSPIQGVVLTGADVDQAWGLLLLRELQPLHIYASASVRRILCADNSMFGMLRRQSGQTKWTDVRPDEAFDLTNIQGKSCGLHCRALPMARRYPAYVSAEALAKLSSEEAVFGLMIESASGGKLAYLPAVAEVTDALLDVLEGVDLVLFDGTFWSDDELIRVQGSGQTARAMGHLPVSSTLERLASLRRPRKIFLHINNTNPILNEACDEHARVRAAGWEIAEDGWQIQL